MGIVNSKYDCKIIGQDGNELDKNLDLSMCSLTDIREKKIDGMTFLVKDSNAVEKMTPHDGKTMHAEIDGKLYGHDVHFSILEAGLKIRQRDDGSNYAVITPLNNSMTMTITENEN